MQTENDTIEKWEGGWTFRLRPAAANPPRKVIVFIHGWTGDENAMTIFTSQTSPEDALIFPRGPVSASPAGYGWAEHNPAVEPKFATFIPSAHALMKLIDAQVEEMLLSNPALTLVGFSQGSALSFTIAVLYPDRVKRLACLAGFYPKDLPFEPPDIFAGKPIYISHGRNDETIPIESAQQMVITLQEAGARVEYCESSAGHKLSVACFEGLSEFLDRS